VKILAHAIAQILRLADVKDFARLVAVDVTARLRRQAGEFFSKTHRG
jgi:hypothetical protein